MLFELKKKQCWLWLSPLVVCQNLFVGFIFIMQATSIMAFLILHGLCWKPKKKKRAHETLLTFYCLCKLRRADAWTQRKCQDDGAWGCLGLENSLGAHYFLKGPWNSWITSAEVWRELYLDTFFPVARLQPPLLFGYCDCDCDFRAKILHIKTATYIFYFIFRE